MPAIPKQNKPQTIFLAVWDHKHGQDVSAHTTENGARKQLITWARESVDEWPTPSESHPYADYTDRDLISNWGEITGDNEFFRVDEVQLHEEKNEKETWVADTSHIGA